MTSGRQTFDFLEAQTEQADYLEACEEFDILLERSIQSGNRFAERRMAELAKEFPEITERD